MWSPELLDTIEFMRKADRSMGYAAKPLAIVEEKIDEYFNEDRTKTARKTMASIYKAGITKTEAEEKDEKIWYGEVKAGTELMRTAVANHFKFELGEHVRVSSQGHKTYKVGFAALCYIEGNTIMRIPADQFDKDDYE